MRKTKLKILCPGCKFETDVTVRRPGFLKWEATKEYALCESCGSTLFLTVTKALKKQGAKPGQVWVDVKLTKAGALLIELIKEEAEARAELAREQAEAKAKKEAEAAK